MVVVLCSIWAGGSDVTHNTGPSDSDSTPDAPVPDGGTGSAEDQDVAGTSSDSESSFSD